ncbi:MAG: GIDE domain-containing protein [Terriglobales bacterium]|jgi:E3 ubiquitin ligase
MFALTFISTSIPPAFWIMPLLGAGAGVYLFYHGFRLLQRKRLIMNTPSSKIRSAAMGLVEVSGLATGPYTLRAPITGVPCYYYRTMVWEWKQRDKGSSWVKEADEGLHVPFYLDDGSARVLVDPQGAEMDIHRDFQEEFSHSLFSSTLEIPGNVAAFLTGHGVETSAKVKVEEYCIKPKNALFVLGTLASNPGIEASAKAVRTWRPAELPVSFSMGSSMSFSESLTFGSYKGNAEPPRSAPGSKTVVADPAQKAKIADALTKAGITNPGAWAAAGINQTQAAAVAVNGGGSAAGAAPAPEQFDLRPPTVLMKGAHSPAFFISWRSQRDVVKSLGWKSTLMIWGGPAITLASVYILAFEFGWL